MSYYPSPRQRHQVWRKRNFLRCNSASGAVATTSAAVPASPKFSTCFWLRMRELSANTALMMLGTNSNAGSDFRWFHQTDGLNLFVSRFSGSNVECNYLLAIDEWYAVSAYLTYGGLVSLGINGVEVDTASSVPAYSSGSVNFQLHFGGSDFDIAGPIVLAQVPYTHAEMYSILKGETVLIPGPSTSPGITLHYGLHEGAGTTVANALGTVAGTNGNMTITGSPLGAEWKVGGFDNPSASAGSSRTPGDWLNMAAWEIANGTTSSSVGEILFEMFDPEATDVRVYAAQAFDMQWFSHGFETGGRESFGPSVKRSPSGGVFPDASVPGRGIQYGALKNTKAVSRAAETALARSSQVYRGGAIVDAKPMAFVHRAASSTDWPESCAVVRAEPPAVTVNRSPHTAEMSRALELRGTELYVVR